MSKNREARRGGEGGGNEFTIATSYMILRFKI